MAQQQEQGPQGPQQQTPPPPSPPSDILTLPTSLRIISLNCWGLKYLSQHRHARLTEIGRQLSLASPAPSLVALQECWTQQDYLAIRALTAAILPHGKFYHSGIFGGGLAILSRWPLTETSMHRYPLNGRPAAFYRGDWYVGKGVAAARVRFGPHPRRDVLEVFCTHLHAPYEGELRDSYLCHRTAQAWEIARLMRHAVERGHLVLGLGDFNMLPCSLAHTLVEAHGRVRDVWRVVRPDSALGAAENEAERRRGRPVPSADECLAVHGATCDSTLNTWRWSKQMRKELDKGRETAVDPTAPDVRAKRLDYIFFAQNRGEGEGHGGWEVADVGVGMTMRHPELRCSLSDHFSVETTLTRRSDTQTKRSAAEDVRLPVQTYDEILAMVAAYELRERKQQKLRLGHFLLEIGVSIGCMVAVWWSPRNFVAFILLLVSTLGLSAGVLDGLMGGLFVNSEVRALKEFEYEIRTAREQAVGVVTRDDKSAVDDK